MSQPFDFHTHRLDATDALITVDPRRFLPQPGKCYSVGFHPWDTILELDKNDFQRLEQCAKHEQVLAIGETGLDSLRGACLDVQRQVFARHLSLAATVGKPVVVHCVRTAQEIVTLRRDMGLTSVAMAIHGMRANERVAQVLLNAGCYLSFGMRYNPHALLATPPERLLIETDDAPESIHEVAATVAQQLRMSTDELINLTRTNALRFLSRPDLALLQPVPGT